MSGEITRIVETSLYVHDLATSEKFYTDVLKLRPHSRAPGRDVFLIAGKSMLLLFNPALLKEIDDYKRLVAEFTLANEELKKKRLLKRGVRR